MRKEISVTTKRNESRWAVVFVSYNEGVRLPLEDMGCIFGGRFLESLERDLEDSEPLYVEDEGDLVQVITIPTLIEAVVNTEDADRIALYNLLGVLEDMLVKIWS